MSVLNLTPIKLIMWCGTRMTHFLTACVIVKEFLVVINSSMYSADIKPNERDLFFSVKMIFCLKIMVDIKKNFRNNYLCQVNKEKILISNV